MNTVDVSTINPSEIGLMFTKLAIPNWGTTLYGFPMVSLWFSNGFPMVSTLQDGFQRPGRLGGPFPGGLRAGLEVPPDLSAGYGLVVVEQRDGRGARGLHGALDGWMGMALGGWGWYSGWVGWVGWVG